jgi:hypothetical protein
VNLIVKYAMKLGFTGIGIADNFVHVGIRKKHTSCMDILNILTNNKKYDIIFYIGITK